MDPRGRKRLEQLLCRHEKRKKDIVALNILNIDYFCNHYMCENDSDLFNDIISLGTQTKNLKTVIDIYDLADRYSPQYASISCYHGIVKDLPLHNARNSSKRDIKLPARKKHQFSEYTAIQKSMKDLIKHMNCKVDFILHNNSLKYYVTHTIRNCSQKTWRICMEDIDLITVQIRKFIKICQFMPPNFKISSTEDYKMYKCFAELLNLCCEMNLKDTETVIHLLLILFQMYPENLEVILNIQQPKYSNKLFDYIMQHAREYNFNIQFCLSEYPNTIWKVANNFSVLEAVASGNKERVLCLMNHGFEVFPEQERRKSCHGFPNISEVMPITHKMILELMKKIKLHSSDVPNNKIVMNSSQKECFNILWSNVPDFYVTAKELHKSIVEEIKHLCRNGVAKKECFIRIRRNRSLLKMYVLNFGEIALSSTKPESIFRHFFYAPYKPEKYTKVYGMFNF